MDATDTIGKYVITVDYGTSASSLTGNQIIKTITTIKSSYSESVTYAATRGNYVRFGVTGYDEYGVASSTAYYNVVRRNTIPTAPTNLVCNARDGA